MTFSAYVSTRNVYAATRCQDVAASVSPPNCPLCGSVLDVAVDLAGLVWT